MSQGEQEPAEGSVMSGLQDLTIRDQTCLESLPDELLVEILSYLPTRDLLMNVALVSKRFQCLSQDSKAHVAVQLPYMDRPSGGRIENFLMGKNHIKSVDMACFPLSQDVKDECLNIFNMAVLQQKLTRSVAMPYILGNNSVLELLAKCPLKAEQITSLKILDSSLGMPVPHLNLLSLEHFSLRGGFSASALDILRMMARQKNLRSIEVECDDDSYGIGEVVALIAEKLSSKMKTVRLPCWEMTQSFFKTHLVTTGPGPHFTMLQSLQFDAGQLNSEDLLQIVQLKGLKKLGMKLNSDFDEQLLIQCLESADLSQITLLVLDTSRVHSGNIFFDEKKAHLRLEDGKFRYVGGPKKSINLTRTLGLTKLDHLTAIDLDSVDLDNYDIFGRFPHLIDLRIKTTEGACSAGLILSLVRMTIEKKLQMFLLRDTFAFELNFLFTRLLVYSAKSSLIPLPDCKKLLADFESFSLHDICINYFGAPIFGAVIQLVQKMSNLVTLSLVLDDLTVSNIAEVLKVAAVRKLKFCRCRSNRASVSCTLQDCNSFDLVDQSLTPADLKVLLESLQNTDLKKMTIRISEGNIQKCLEQAVGLGNNLLSLHVHNAPLGGVPKLSNLDLETLILDMPYNSELSKGVGKLSDNDLDNIAALPKLKYLQVAQKTCPKEDFFVFRYVEQRLGHCNLRVVVYKDKIEAIKDVTEDEIKNAFECSEHLLKKTPPTFYY